MEEIVNIEDNVFIISLNYYENNPLTSDYPCIIFSLGENNPCENWSLKMKNILPILCDKLVDLIKNNKPDKFCFITKDDEIYQLYKSTEIPYLVNDEIKIGNITYVVKERNIKMPLIGVRISFYDKVN